MPGLSPAAAPPSAGAVSAPSLLVSVHSIAGYASVSSSLPPPPEGSTRYLTAPADGGCAVALGQGLCLLAAQPQTTILRVAVLDHGAEAAHAAISLGYLRRGYRCLPLRDPSGARIAHCALLLHVRSGGLLRVVVLLLRVRVIAM